jgi:phage-related protein
MGLISKLFKGVKKVVKKIGKGIKSAFKSVGKFMGKLGIIGQIGLGLLMPGIGSMFGKFAGALIGTGGTVATAAGNFINAALNIGTKVGNVFSSITKGVTNVIGEVVGAAANQLGLANPIKNFTGALGINKGNGWNVAGKDFNSVMNTVSNAGTDLLSKGQDLFSMDTLTGKHASVSKYLDELKVKRDALVPDLNVSAEMDSVTNEFTGKLVETPDIVLEDSMAKAKALATGPNLTGVENMSRGLDGTIASNTAQMSTVADGVTNVATEPKSLLSKASDFVVEKAGDARVKLGEALTDAPSKFVSTAVTTAGQKAGGGIPDVNYTTNVASVASMPTSLSIGSGDYAGDVNLNAYMDNTNYMNASPYGHTAAIYNYGQSMRGVG